MYYQPETKQSFATHADIRAALANVLFPPSIDDDMLAFAGVFPLAYAPPAVSSTQIATPIEPELVNGIWTQMWEVRQATQEEIEARAADIPAVPDYVTAIQAMLDAKVAERRYLGIISACSYAASTNPTFKAEADACLAWRDAVWLKAYQALDQVTAGTLPQPTIPDLLAMLPTMTWPT